MRTAAAAARWAELYSATTELVRIENWRFSEDYVTRGSGGGVREKPEQRTMAPTLAVPSSLMAFIPWLLRIRLLAATMAPGLALASFSIQPRAALGFSLNDNYYCEQRRDACY